VSQLYAGVDYLRATSPMSVEEVSRALFGDRRPQEVLANRAGYPYVVRLDGVALWYHSPAGPVKVEVSGSACRRVVAAEGCSRSLVETVTRIGHIGRIDVAADLPYDHVTQDIVSMLLHNRCFSSKAHVLKHIQEFWRDGSIRSDTWYVGRWGAVIYNHLKDAEALRFEYRFVRNNVLPVVDAIIHAQPDALVIKMRKCLVLRLDSKRTAEQLPWYVTLVQSAAETVCGTTAAQ
jgi:hypothetical protein